MYKNWICKCGHEVLAKKQPQPMRWTDGHVCHFHELFVDISVNINPPKIKDNLESKKK